MAAEWKKPVTIFTIYLDESEWISWGVFKSLACKLPSWLYILKPHP